MLSIIISSYRYEMGRNLVQNIQSTIGKAVEYEIIKIKNNGAMGLCQAYNKGLHQAKFPYVLFLHEDLHFNSFNWGKTLIDIFRSDENIGLIGIAGATHKTKAPSPWWENGNTSTYVFIRHRDSGKDQLMNLGFNTNSSNVIDVVSIDGVFMALKRSTQLQFNERFSGYHQYDLSLCIEASKNKVRIVCTNLIDITHYSLGNLDQEWIKSADLLFKIYSGYLPLFGISIPKATAKKLEVENTIRFIERALAEDMKELAWKYWWYLFKLEPFKRISYSTFRTIWQSKIPAKQL